MQDAFDPLSVHHHQRGNLALFQNRQRRGGQLWLDRHEQIGKGTMGLEPFRRLLNDPRFAHAAFIAETPVDAPGDEERNVKTLLSLVE